MVVKTNPEFGVELALTIPYAYWLHQNGELEGVVTSKGMRPYYYFCDNVKEEFEYRTIDNKAAGLDSLPNNWIHGINSLEEPGVLDYTQWSTPSYREYYSNTEYTFNRPVVFITNKYNMEHGEVPFGYFNIQALYDIFTVLGEKGYDIIYKRATNKEKEFTIDQNEMNSLQMGYHDITADVEGVGVINDFQLCNYFEHVTLLEDIVTKSKDSYNETQLKVMANSDKFITVCGGNSILSAMFDRDVISYVHKGKELRPNYFGPDSYFQKLSKGTVYPAYDVMGHINTNTYDHKVNNTGTNDYSEVFRLINEHF